MRTHSNRRLLRAISSGEYRFSHDVELDGDRGSNFKNDVRGKFLGVDKKEGRRRRKKHERDKGAEKRGVLDRSILSDAIEHLANLTDNDLIDVVVYDSGRFGKRIEGLSALEFDSYDLQELRELYVKQFLKDLQKDLKRVERNRYKDLRKISRRQAEIRDEHVPDVGIKRTARKKGTWHSTGVKNVKKIKANPYRRISKKAMRKREEEILTKKQAHRRLREESKASIEEQLNSW